MNLAKEHDIRLTVASLAWLDQLLGQEADLSGLKVHIKVDSGMGRIGFRTIEEIKEGTPSLSSWSWNWRNLYSFCDSRWGRWSKIPSAIPVFQRSITALKTLPPIVHASNSATSLWHADTIFTAVRLGDVMYGLNPRVLCSLAFRN